MSVSNINYSHKVSNVKGQVPEASDLLVGQLLINIADVPPSLYTKLQDGTVTQLVGAQAEQAKDYYTKAQCDAKYVAQPTLDNYITLQKGSELFVTNQYAQANYLTNENAQATYAPLVKLNEYMVKIGDVGSLANWEALVTANPTLELTPSSSNVQVISADTNVTITLNCTMENVSSVKTVLITNNTNESKTLTVNSALGTTVVWQNNDPPSWGSPNSKIVLVFYIQGSTVYSSIFYSTEV